MHHSSATFRPTAAVGAVLLSFGLMAGMLSSTASAADATDNTGAGESASQVLETLAVKGRAPKTGYKRTQFGVAWKDVDHNGCDTRNDILNRDLTDVKHKVLTHDCVVKSGTLNDPYTGKTIDFKRGNKTSTAVQIDHVVALSNAWQTGAQKLSKTTRTELANDPYNLLAVDGPANQQKSDGDAATWLPSNKSFRCEYVARQIGVKHKYSLWVTQSEKNAMSNVLSACPTQTIPNYTGTNASASASADGSTADDQSAQQESSQQSQQETQQQTQEQAQQQTQQQTTTPQQQSGSSVYYQNCTAVRAAGAAPLYQGQPGYRSALDRDHDGVACE